MELKTAIVIGVFVLVILFGYFMHEINKYFD